MKRIFCDNKEFGCLTSFDMENHLKNECNFHHCPGIDCMWKGKISELDDHLKNCDKFTKKCPFFAIGCEFIGNMTKIKEHNIKSMDYHENLANNLQKTKEIPDKEDIDSPIKISDDEKEIDINKPNQKHFQCPKHKTHFLFVYDKNTLKCSCCGKKKQFIEKTSEF